MGYKLGNYLGSPSQTRLVKLMNVISERNWARVRVRFRISLRVRIVVRFCGAYDLGIGGVP